MKNVRFLVAIGNTAAGDTQRVSDVQAAHLVSAGHAEEVDGPGREETPGPGPISSAPATAREIREWAAGYGMSVPEKGRIPKHVRQAYEDNH